MSRFVPGGALSSRLSTAHTISVRLAPDLAAAVDAACEKQGTTHSEFLRDLISRWVYGESQLSGPDEGYSQARSMATQLAFVALKKALSELPDSHQAARSMLDGYHDKEAHRRRKT